MYSDNKIFLIDLQYLPCIEYFTWLLAYDKVILDLHRNYQKQTYSNRCYILSSQQIDRLTVPVLDGKKKIPFQDIKIDHQQKWVNNHWRSICTAYGKAPYFEYFSTYFHQTLAQPYVYLYQLNLALLKLCLNLMRVQIDLQTTQQVASIPAPYQDARQLIHPRTENIPKDNRAIPYQQVFGTTFNANLSIIDLLFCEGPNAYHIIKKSYVSPSAAKVKP